MRETAHRINPLIVRSSPELSVVIPTFNERENVGEVVKRLDACLRGIHWEVIFVDDDSPDGTARVVREIAGEDYRVRLVHRVGRRGLSSACIEGMLASSSPYLAVMDADLQHDERLLPYMLSVLKDENLDVVIGSRNIEGGGMGNLAADRQNKSQIAARLSNLMLKNELKDPMSGFFAMKKEVLLDSVRNLSGIGFKILLDIFASSPRPLKFKELPYTFRMRRAGESKLDSMVAWEYVMMLLDKTFGRYVPVRFIPFALIGGVGVVVHLAVLWLIYRYLGHTFVSGQIVATLAAMTSNFFLNNTFTYRDRRLIGWGLLRGWISFALACSIGTISNVGVATYLFHGDTVGWIGSALSGIIVGAVWNYAVTSVYTWNKPKGG